MSTVSAPIHTSVHRQYERQDTGPETYNNPTCTTDDNCSAHTSHHSEISQMSTTGMAISSSTPTAPFSSTPASLLATPSSSLSSVSISSISVSSSASDASVATTAAIASSSPFRATRGNATHAGAIAGGVIGGLAGLAILTALLFGLLRRYRKSHTAPSAEFMGKMHPGTPPSHEDIILPLARHTSIEDVDAPPPFTSGSFSDPVFEKVRASERMQEEYRIRDELFDARNEKTALIA